MPSKIKVGMLVSFKSRNPYFWVGVKNYPVNDHEKKIWEANEEIKLGSPFVTVLEKKGALFYDMWVSYAKILGQDTKKQPIKLWVLAYCLKPAKNYRKSQSKDL